MAKELDLLDPAVAKEFAEFCQMGRKLGLEDLAYRFYEKKMDEDLAQTKASAKK